MLGVRPVLVRELRTLARQRSFYGIRVAAGAVALGLVGYIWLNLRLPPTLFGAAVFTCMANLLFCAIWVVGPLISSDCISSEKREGTLPLLFLTPLRPGEIILAKLGAQLLRTGTLLLAVIPVLVIPLLFGGVTWMDVARAILLNVSALLISLTIGAFASTLTKRRAFGTVLAFLLSIGTSVNFVAAYLVVRSGIWGATNRSIGQSFEMMGNLLSQPAVIFSMIESKLAAFSVILGAHPFISNDVIFAQSYAQAVVSRSFGRASMTSVQVAGLLFVLAVLGVVVVHLVATFQLRRFWRENPASPVVEKAKRVFFKPVLFESRFRRKRREALTKNPIRGISSLSVGNRLHKWWLLLALMAVVLLDLVDLSGRWRSGILDDGITGFTLFLAFAISYVACSGFRSEKSSGVLELLLVTPISPRSVIFGRMLAIATTFSLVTVALFTLLAFSNMVFSGRIVDEVVAAAYAGARFTAGAYLMISVGFWISSKNVNVIFATCIVVLTGFLFSGGISAFFSDALQQSRYGYLAGGVQVFGVETSHRGLGGDLSRFNLWRLAIDLIVPFLIGNHFIRRHCRDLGERRFVSG